MLDQVDGRTAPRSMEMLRGRAPATDRFVAERLDSSHLGAV
jgi:hypothetical protein